MKSNIYICDICKKQEDGTTPNTSKEPPLHWAELTVHRTNGYYDYYLTGHACSEECLIKLYQKYNKN